MSDKGMVLVVDDVPDNLDMLFIVLNTAGYNVEVARNGEAAIEIAQNVSPDIILLDVMMPGIDGFETCERLKALESTRDIPVIFMTALTETHHKIKGFEIGAVDFVTKPIQNREVVARVDTHLTMYRQRKEIERLREQDRAYFEKLLQIRDEVLRATSHDLKSPLGNIMISAYLLDEHLREDDEQGKRLLQSIQTGADRMLGLITDLLDIAAIETGLAIKKQPVSLYEFTKNSLDAFVPQAQSKSINLNLDCLDDDLTVVLDPRQMGRVLQNLLSNAIKYTPEGGNVELKAGYEDNTVVIRIIDNGFGIPPDDVPRLFEKFYRVNTDKHQTQEGTGLGLSIAKSIVEQHGGDIRVESELNQGSTFTITLPLEQPVPLMS